MHFCCSKIFQISIAPKPVLSNTETPNSNNIFISIQLQPTQKKKWFANPVRCISRATRFALFALVVESNACVIWLQV